MAALKVINGKQENDLQETIVEVDKKGKVRVKKMTRDDKEDEPVDEESMEQAGKMVAGYNAPDMLDLDPWQKGTRRRLKEWVKDNARRRGEDQVLWGR